jgi:hypothetical protein
MAAIWTSRNPPNRTLYGAMMVVGLSQPASSPAFRDVIRRCFPFKVTVYLVKGMIPGPDMFVSGTAVGFRGFAITVVA